jgi:hypothetical protein
MNVCPSPTVPHEQLPAPALVTSVIADALNAVAFVVLQADGQSAGFADTCSSVHSSAKVLKPCWISRKVMETKKLEVQFTKEATPVATPLVEVKKADGLDV